MSGSVVYTEFSAVSVTLNQSSRPQDCCDKGGFDKLLASFEADISRKTGEKRADELLAGNYARDFIDVLLAHFDEIQRGENTAVSALEEPFPLSPAFTSVFGSRGPLIDFINQTTVSLGLSAEKNLALQTIAINNQDATRSKESIDKITQELRQAGITA